MNTQDEELHKQLIETFKIEAREHINAIGSGLINLEKSNTVVKTEAQIEIIYRAAHSMKGAARAVNLRDIERTCQALEGTFSYLKNKEISLSPQLFDLFHKVLNSLELLLTQVDDPDISILPPTIERYISILNNIKSYTEEHVQEAPSDEEQKEDTSATDGSMLNNLKSIMVQYEVKEEEDSDIRTDTLQHDPAYIQPEQNSKKEAGSRDSTNMEVPQKIRASSNTVRLSTGKIDSLYIMAEEMLHIKLLQKRSIDEFGVILADFEDIKKNWEKLYFEILRFRQDAEKSQNENEIRADISKLIKQFPVFDNINNKIKSLEKKGLHAQSYQKYDIVYTSSMIDGLMQEVKKILMLPFSNLFDTFPRISRELARDMGKDVEFITNGTEIEVDRRIMEDIKDPVIHIIRNAVDHGIEEPAERRKTQKPEKGKIEINIQQIESSKVELTISDDGAGFDKNKILNKAVNLKLITRKEAESLTDNDINMLVFKSGLSTSSIITDISGRGLGLAIAEEKIEKLGGKISIKSTAGQGSSFVMVLPSIMAKYQGLNVKLTDQEFLIPIANITETARIHKRDIQTVKNRETIRSKESTVALVNLAEVLLFSALQHPKNFP